MLVSIILYVHLYSGKIRWTQFDFCLHIFFQKRWDKFTTNQGATDFNRMFPKIVVHPIIHFYRVFYYKPSILGNPIVGNTQQVTIRNLGSQGQFRRKNGFQRVRWTRIQSVHGNFRWGVLEPVESWGKLRWRPWIGSLEFTVTPLKN